MTRPATRTLPIHLLLAMLLLSAPHATASESATPARAFAFPAVQRAWEEGESDGVKDWMRSMLKRSKKAKLRIPSTGKKPKCGSCHDNLKKYPLSPNAIADLQGLLEMLGARSAEASSD